MKRYKRLISIATSMMIIILGCVSVSAKDYSYIQSDEETETIRTMAHDYIYEKFDGAPIGIYVASKPYDLDFNGYKIISASSNVSLPMIMLDRIGSYMYSGVSYSYPSDLGHLVINPETGDVIVLEEALKDGIVDEDVFYEYTGGNAGFKMYPIGDANDDGILSVSDATQVQKAAANLVEVTMIKGFPDDTVFDFNGDGEVNIIDATKIQKSLIS